MRNVAQPWRVTYYSAKQRCENPKALAYRFYGAKGIKMLLTMEEIKTLWFRDKADQLLKPSIDRINSKGNYTFENCRFIEVSENSKKRILETTHCVNGHEFTQFTTGYKLRNGARARVCLTCRLLGNLKYRRRKLPFDIYLEKRIWMLKEQLSIMETELARLRKPKAALNEKPE